ncbi:MAG: regulatory protein RecX [Spirochaetes bacterium]|jgi:regulatory protein|nr:regulatory protein RecX [Spirochaetota bacterium]
MDCVNRIIFSRNTMRLYFESGTTITLPISIEYSARYSSGDQLSEDEMERLRCVSENYLCRERALRYIANPHSEKQIRDYLVKKEFSVDAINTAIVFLKQMNYIDDAAYARRYLFNLVNRKVVGRIYAQNRLKQTGVDNDTINRILDEEALLFKNSDAVFAFACKKYESVRNKKNSYAKLVYALSSRGFSSAEVYRVIESMKSAGYKFEKLTR